MGPSLLVQKDVNGVYALSTSGAPDDPVLFSATLASGGPIAPSGADYYSVLTGSITPKPAAGLGDCDTKAVELTGRVTNPDGLNVYIDATGQTVGGGTLTLHGTLGTYIQNKVRDPLGSTFSGTIQVDGGSCTLPSTTFVAYH